MIDDLSWPQSRPASEIAATPEPQQPRVDRATAGGRGVRAMVAAAVQTVRYDADPMTTFRQPLSAGFIRMLPVDTQL